MEPMAHTGRDTGEWDGLDDDGLAWLSATLGTDAAANSQVDGAVRSSEPVTEEGVPLQPPAPAPPREPPPTEQRPHRLMELFVLAASVGASDIHLSAGCAPHLRVRGELRPVREVGPLSPRECEEFLVRLLHPTQWTTLQSCGDLDAALAVPAAGKTHRIRASVFRQQGSYAAAFRMIATAIPSMGDLGLPSAVTHFASLDHGLVLVTGRTGSGKSTTLASMIETINRSRSCHIVTVEDPIEFEYTPRQAVIQQREVGVDTVSFATALRHALRQDPDVILLGELRDLETIRTALTAAETGHLVLATLHSGDTSGAIHRLIDVFPADQQSQIRSQLALSLQGILSQSLELAGSRLVPITEVLVANGAIRHLIRDDKVHQIRSVIETGIDEGMHTMEQSRAKAAAW